MVFWIAMAINKSIGHISSLPIHISTMKTSFTTTGDVEVRSENRVQRYSDQMQLQTILVEGLDNKIIQ